MAKSPEVRAEGEKTGGDFNFPVWRKLDLDVDSSDIFLGKIPLTSAESALYSVLAVGGGYKISQRDLYLSGEDAVAVFVSPKDEEVVKEVYRRVIETKVFGVLKKAYEGIVDIDGLKTCFPPKHRVSVITFAWQVEEQRLRKDFLLGKASEEIFKSRKEAIQAKLKGGFAIAKALGIPEGGLTPLDILDKECRRVLHEIRSH